jgi:hypothetical protein
MDRQQMERYLQVVAAYRASGLRANVWAEANGVSVRQLASWCAHAGRWQKRLEGASTGTASTPKANGFIAARVAPGSAASCIRVELSAGSSRVEIHWPVSHARDLAAFVRGLGQ